MKSTLQKYQPWLDSLGIFILAAAVRLTSLNVFRAIDEEDRWAWAVQFYQALLKGNLAGTLVGDGYPGIFPVWLETLWLFGATVYRSVLEGGWIGDIGVKHLIHEWSRMDHLWLQRFPVVLTNTLIVVLLFIYIRRLFNRPVALVAAILICLDPFYLSDSRVNRAEALLTGCMTLSLLTWLDFLRHEQTPKGQSWHLFISGLFGALSFLTKLQALVLLPILACLTFIWYWQTYADWVTILRHWFWVMIGWGFIVLALFMILWPATWTAPQDTFTLMYHYLTRKVGEEGVNIFFLGQIWINEDPGWLFYPVIFILRLTPLTFFGLILGVWLMIQRWQADKTWRIYLDEAGVWTMVLYCLLYTAAITWGSHKQDRFLMNIFPLLNILAALSYVNFFSSLKKNLRKNTLDLSKEGRQNSSIHQGVFQKKRPTLWGSRLALSIFLGLQLFTVLPFHPYYFSYFNPLVGGGPVATNLTRIGWGEGMNEVADYLNTLENPDQLAVATRFTKYLLGFQGENINLHYGTGWERADKIVFYIQQAQRLQHPTPGIIRYFQKHVEPEKIITIDRIDYAWIYPNPIHYAADPKRDRLKAQIALLGYRWDSHSEGGTAHLIWENLGGDSKGLAVRLWAAESGYKALDLPGLSFSTDWQACQVAAGFNLAAKTPGEVVESACVIDATDIPPGLYNLEVGYQQTDQTWQVIKFAAGWTAIHLTEAGQLERILPEEAFAHLADQAIPTTAPHLKHVFDHKIRLLAYELTPSVLQPSQALTVTLYWQNTAVLDREAHTAVQIFLGDQQVANVNGVPANGTRPTTTWLPGEIIRDQWIIPLPPNLTAPALLRIDAELFWPETNVPLKVKNVAGEDIPNALEFIRLKPPTWPTYQGSNPLNIIFGEVITLLGYNLTSSETGYYDLTLYWQAQAAPTENYATFVHVLNAEGQLVAQSDVPPGGGQYPTDFWQPGDTLLSHHHLDLSGDVPSGMYTLLAGMYRYHDFVRLSPVSPLGEIYVNDAVPISVVEKDTQ